MFTCGFFALKTKKLLVFENEFQHAYEDYETNILMKIVLVAIRKSQLAPVCPWFGQKKSSKLFCAQLIATGEKAVRKHVNEIDPLVGRLPYHQPYPV
jgi:hypothetical protein